MEPVRINQNDPFTIFVEILIVVILARIIYIKLGYKKPNRRILLAFLPLALAYFIGFSSYLPDHGLSLVQQKTLAVCALSLALLPLFSKPRRKERIPFAKVIRRQVLKKQKHKCAKCRKALIQFNVDFHHSNGNRSDNRLSNCRALCTPCHRKRHSYEG
jgi:hypothetical protein